MAEINLNILVQDTPTKVDEIIFNDLRLDLTLGYTRNNELEKGKEVRDIIDDVNIKAIENAFINLLTTSPGQKPLNPTFGINFGDLLFLPVTRARADVIGEGIVTNIERFEPRVNVINLTITPEISQQQYICDFTYNIPRFKNEKFNITGRLSKGGFYL